MLGTWFALRAVLGTASVDITGHNVCVFNLAVEGDFVSCFCEQVASVVVVAVAAGGAVVVAAVGEVVAVRRPI